MESSELAGRRRSRLRLDVARSAGESWSPIGYRAPSVTADVLLDATRPASTARIAEGFFCGVAQLALALGPSASRTGHEARCSNTSLEQGPAARGPLRIGTPHRPPAPQRLNPGALPMGVRSPGTASLEAAAARHGRKRLRDCSWSEYAALAIRPEADSLSGHCRPSAFHTDVGFRGFG